MKLTSFFFLIVAFFSANITQVQATNAHNETYNSKTIKNSLYRNVEFLDTRPKNEFDNLKIDGETFWKDLQAFVNQTTDNTALKGTLFVNLRNCNIYFSKTKNCYVSHIRISLFDHIKNNYYMIGSLDETIEIPKNENPNTVVSDLIYKYVSDNLAQSITDITPYQIDDIRNFDLMEKLKMPLFSNGMLTDGIYTSYDDFRDQYPLDDVLSADIRDNQIYNVRATNEIVKKSVTVNPNNIYAIVYDGQPYIAIDNKFVPLYLENNDYWFIEPTKAKNIHTTNRIAETSKMVKNNQERNVVYKVDHLNGDPIQISVK